MKYLNKIEQIGVVFAWSTYDFAPTITEGRFQEIEFKMLAYSDSWKLS